MVEKLMSSVRIQHFALVAAMLLGSTADAQVLLSKRQSWRLHFSMRPKVMRRKL